MLSPSSLIMLIQILVKTLMHYRKHLLSPMNLSPPITVVTTLPLQLQFLNQNTK